LFAHSEPAGGTPACLWPVINNRQAFYDPFLGSGTSLDCARNDWPRLLRSELKPLYVDVIARRCQVFTGRATMHQAPGQSFDECADRQDHNQSGVAHGAKTVRRD
jgi:hypothetical protein